MKFIASVVLLMSFQAQAQMAASVVLNPVGDFIAKSVIVKGQAIQQGTKVHAENITVDMRVVQTGMSLRDTHLKEKYLETKKYPEAVLVSADGENGKGKGILRLKDIEKPIEGTYEINGGKLTAHFPIKLSDYGIKDVSYQGVGPEDEIKVDITVPVVAGVIPAPKPAAAKAKPSK